MPNINDKLINTELERSLIGALLLTPTLIKQVKEVLKPEMVYDVRYRAVYETLLDMSREKKTIDSLLVLDEMKTKNRAQAIKSDIEFLNGLAMSQEADPLGAAEGLKQKHNLRLLMSLHGELQQQVMDGMAPKEVIEQANIKITEIVNSTYRNDLQKIGAYLGGYIIRLNEHIKRGSEYLGIGSGYPDMDRLTSGLIPGEYILIAGRTGMGKTAFALSIAAYVATSRNVLIFSLEMNRDELITRVASQLSGVPLYNCRNPKTMNDRAMSLYMDALGRVGNLNLIIDESPALSMPEITNISRAFARNNPLGLIIIDHNQRVKADKAYKTEALKVQQITIDQADLAKELKVPIIGLHQMSREIERRDENAEPKLTDLRESGEENANAVIFLIRNTDGTFGYILKNRGGPLGKWRMNFNENTARYESIDDHGEYTDGRY